MAVSRLVVLLAVLGAVGPGTVGAQVQRPAAAHYDVVALRVEFQPDTTRFTTGDGTFGGVLFADGLEPKIDPLPHDAAYFEAHLAFLEDYVARVSDGQTQVTTHLVPEVVRVSQEMGAYSPTGLDADSDAERGKLIALIEEAWTTASQVSTFDLAGFDPERTAFVLFHAGAGRDIELLGTTLDKTPLDLPSIFFSERELARLGGGNIRFNGVRVRHAVLLPRTESRPGFNFITDEAFLLELSINGLLAASFFNYLGVPDLFNTQTGEPAIGPFGLMDPLGIFAYGGLFPPEPTAWTKVYLGWAEPLDLVGDGPQTVTLPAAGLAGPAPIARAPISAAEYFLIENRYRDPEDDGLLLRIWQRGEIIEQRIQNGQEGFTRFDVSNFAGGVVLSVDNYDWALPGGIDENDNPLNGGILVWHIDERRLAAGIQSGGVNADPERRAVDLEEADSAQDLGFPLDNPFGPAADQGTPFDFYFRDNPITTIAATGQEIRFYENRFGPETIPSSDSNEGGPSFITLDDFSAPGPEMTVVFRREGALGVTPSLTRQLTSAIPVGTGGLVSRTTGASPELVVFNGDAVPFSRVTLLAGDGRDAERIFSFGSVPPQPVVLPGEQGGVATAFLSGDGPFIGLSVIQSGSPRPISSTEATGIDVSGLRAPLITLPDGGQEAFYALGTTADGAAAFEMREDATARVLAGSNVRTMATDGSQVILVEAQEARTADGAARWTYDRLGDDVGQAVFGSDVSGLVGVVPADTSGLLLWLLADGSVQRADLSRYAHLVGGTARQSVYPVLVDLDDDGRLDVLTTYGRSLIAVSQQGALVRGFPLALPAPSVTQPLVAQLTDSGAWSILTALTDGYVYAYDLGDRGRQVEGFPLAVGARIEATPLLQDNTLYAVEEQGSLRVWELSGVGAVWWGQLYGNAQHHSYVDLAADADPSPGPQAAGLIVEAETYNWPNPIRSGQTFLRCMTSEDATVRITIIDAAGSLIDEIELEVDGGAPAEHQWQTDAASGLYFARVTATSASGQTATKLIKMAIIR